MLTSRAATVEDYPEEPPPDIVGWSVARTPPESFVAQYGKMRGAARRPAARARRAEAKRS